MNAEGKLDCSVKVLNWRKGGAKPVKVNAPCLTMSMPVREAGPGLRGMHVSINNHHPILICHGPLKQGHEDLLSTKEGA